MNHAFASPAEVGPHFTDPGGMEDWVDKVGWLNTQMVYQYETGRRSPIQPGPMLINFVDQSNVVNHYTTPPTVGGYIVRKIYEMPLLTFWQFAIVESAPEQRLETTLVRRNAFSLNEGTIRT